MKQQSKTIRGLNKVLRVRHWLLNNDKTFIEYYNAESGLYEWDMTLNYKEILELANTVKLGKTNHLKSQ